MTKKSIIITAYLVISIFISIYTYGGSIYLNENFLPISDTTNKSDDSLRVTVNITFIVDKKGKVKNVELIETECDSCDSEIKKNCEEKAIKLVLEMPNWEPARKNGKLKEVRYNLPIKFVIPKNIKKE